MKTSACAVTKRYLRGVLLIAVILLAGCITGPPTPVEVQSQVSSVDASVSPIKGVALIKGSNVASPWLLDNHTTSISCIDGKPVMGGKADWNTNLEIDAGLRTITVVVYDLWIFYQGQDTLQFNAVPGANYIVKFNVPFLGTAFNVWIVDAKTDKPVTNVDVVPVQSDDDDTADIPDDVPYVDIGGAQHARPPLDRDEHASHPGEHPIHSGGTPSHQSRPPSIPHNPRPKSGGGGKRSSGGNHGGGGGGKRK
jgi:hypothetical protein